MLSNIRFAYISEYCNKYYPTVDFDDKTDLPFLSNSTVEELFIPRFDKIVQELTTRNSALQPRHFTFEEYTDCKPLQDYITKHNWGNDAIEKMFDMQARIDREQNKERIFPKEERMQARKEAFWAFTVFLHYAVDRYFTNQWTSISQEIQQTNEFIQKNIKTLKLRLVSGKKSIDVSNENIIKGLLATFHCKGEYYKDMEIEHRTMLNGKVFFQQTQQLREYDPMFVKENKVTEREKSYIIIKNIADELMPPKPIGVQYTNDEKILYQYVLILCGFIQREVSKEFTYRDTAETSKLLRDFKDKPSNLPLLDLVF